MSLDPNKITIVQWFPELQRHTCGYCKTEDSSAVYGMWAETMTVDDYQSLIDRGWRRSGKYCYKPVMKETCCPLYTIRCEALNFKPSKSQKKVVKRFNRYLRDGKLIKATATSPDDDEGGHDEARDFALKVGGSKFLKLDDITNSVFENGDAISAMEDEKTSKKDEAVVVSPQKIDVSAVSQPSSSMASPKPKQPVKAGIGADPSRPPCKKAKLLRMERKQRRREESGAPPVPTPTSKGSGGATTEKTIGDLLSETSELDRHRLKVVLVPTSRPGVEWERTKAVEYEVYQKYQEAVHDDRKCSMHGFTRFLVTSPLKVIQTRMSPNHIHFKVGAALYAKYQQSVHGDEPHQCDEATYVEFLVDSPLEPRKFANGDDEAGYGSFHQQYWIDDRLIAVGVIDILPKCVSSVYFFYDPDYRGLTFGTYGSLMEIEFVRKLYLTEPNLCYYYMGFYIHSCPKMRYKGRLSPSHLLCPETYTWFPIEKCTPKLDISRYSRLDDNLDAVDDERCTRKDIAAINVLLGRQFCKFGHYRHYAEYLSMFENIGTLVGRRCARSMLFVDPHS